MVTRIDRALLEKNWPRLEVFDIKSKVMQGDTLVVASGFEERALAVIKDACDAGISDLNVIAFEYFPELVQNRTSAIQEACCLPGWSLHLIRYDRNDPTGAFQAMSSHLRTNGRIFVDISGMSRLMIVQLVVGLIRSDHHLDVSILYTAAAEYSPTETEARNRLAAQSTDLETVLSFTSTGVFGLSVLPELASTSPHQAPIRLIAFPSFNPAQLLSARSVIQPSHISIIHGVPERQSLTWRTEIIASLNQIDDVGLTQELYASTRDYSESLQTLLKLYDQWAEFSTLVLVPTGSKMQSVACGIFRAFVEDVQVVYPAPLRFTDPESHTVGVEATFDLSLNAFVDWRLELEQDG